MEEMKTKRCSKCGRELTVDNFHKKAAAKDGLQTECIECRRKMLSSMRSAKKMHKVFSNPELAKFQPKDLILELKARGYSGELSFTQRIIV